MHSRLCTKCREELRHFNKLVQHAVIEPALKLPFRSPVQSKLGDSSPPEGHRSKQNKRRLSEEDDEIEELGPMDFVSAKQKLVSVAQCYYSISIYL
jgi:hypothetical protein